MLGRVRDEVLDRCHDLIEESGPVNESTEAGDLTSNRRPDLSFVVLQKFDKGRNKISRNHLIINRLGNLEIVSNADSTLWKRRTFSNLSAIIYRTLQLLSSIKLRNAVKRTP